MASTHNGDDQLAPQIASLAFSATEYAEAHAHPEWLQNVKNDQQFVDELKKHLLASEKLQENTVVLGSNEVWNRLREAADRVTNAVPAKASQMLLRKTRASIHKTVATFIGDIMVYLHGRDADGANSPIIQAVLADLKTASAVRCKSQEPIVVVAHSMGGNIMYDILTKFAPELDIDVLVTVGSQPPLMEELKLLAISQKGIPSKSVPLAPHPPGAKKWINIFDTNDILSFAASRVFYGVKDFKYSTGESLLHAHSSYFIRPSFQRRVGLRIKEVW